MIRSVYLLGPSFLEREMRPWKGTVFLPAWPVKWSVPLVRVTLQESHSHSD